MAIKYPNGQPYHDSTHQPLSKKAADSKPVQHGHRGMSLEQELNRANEFYLQRGIANIHKKPTPIQIVHVDYPKRAAAKITEAYFQQASTTDYNGIYQGHYLDFDAKETNSPTAFPLNNLHQHQVTHLLDTKRLGGISFLIIRFTKYQETYCVPIDAINQFWERRKTERQSIPYQAIVQHGVLIQPSLYPSLPYLEAVDHII
ncbi:Holliday junction resolvase RecU [Weissella kandleri]|uniref:Holliday junction resolvase RecU n=1 Tax=Weissella kandleri TaxID=1616 RepID=UPI000709F2B8|nr:Holliday junction resolvase RecU [Weissella kandleri]